MDEWILENLKLKLSPTKTLITNLVGHSIDGAKFLGFELSKQKRFKIVHIDKSYRITTAPLNRKKRTKISRTNSNITSHTQRVASHTIYVRFDRNR